jgi:hypothetical protein
MVKRLTLLLVLFILLLAIFGESIGRGISRHLATMNNRVQLNKATMLDKLQCTVFYNSMIYIGGIAYPEAADILENYIYGKGENLYLEPDYLKESPVIARNLMQMHTGESRNIGLKQEEDWRLSYAVNGFTLRKKKEKAQLLQYIVFSKDKQIYTDLNFYLFEVRVPDGLVHALNPTPFTVYSEWEL